MPTNFVVHPEYQDQQDMLLGLLKNFDTAGEYVVKGERNAIKKFEVGDTVFNIKKFKTPNAFQSLVYRFLRKGKAKRSFEYAKKLEELGIGTPAPVAYFERFGFGLKESYYISKHMEYDFDFRVLNHNPLWPNRKEILEQFAAFTFQMHEKGINFLDHSPGNTLICEAGNGNYNFYLIDLNRMRFEDMGFKKRMHNFRRLWLSKTMINIMSPVYAKLCGMSEDEVHHWMTYYSRNFQRKVNAKKLRRRRRRK
ncbi:lipopolysaccharide kinase InaA family protein [Aureisphaera galaxeae]|uniref:lipopolysaccharide kinase InaA family protein n=1 Tax=Aureisphaera galaxeae TaxID=1538023 RepID=UPI0023506EE8|nr:lipopolysaccharide kinase InaA family protein [Aureisphaera galaxeae]MDC8003443.1 lipopolysaccharide kinase InaA family protein [Aureisphaera galaxeae]